MGYVQMTLNDWLEMKQSLERELSNLKTGFIRVGYVLRRIEETRGYEQDGYKTIAEFAKEEYGLSASTVSRFMAINERFSLGGYSERLDPQYIGFRQSIMGELLGLPDQDLELVTPETSRRDVRELKQFNKKEPVKGIADDLRGLIENYFRENREELNELYDGSGQATQEILNPSGNKVYRKGMYMMFFYTDNVKTKKFGGETTQYSWEEFRELIDGVFASSAGEDTYGNYFKKPSPELEPEETQEESVVFSEDENMPAAEGAGREEEPEKGKPEEDKPAEGFAEKTESISAKDAEGAERLKPEEAEGENAAGKTMPAETEDTIAPAQKSRGKAGRTEPPASASGPERKTEYDRAVADAGEKLDEIRQSLEEKNWFRMSEQVISLGFIVNQLKAMGTIAD